MTKNEIKAINKKDFAIVFSVKNANPNGDPNNGNRPRQSPFDSIGEISDVAIKRKIRNRFMDYDQDIFVQSEDRTNDGFRSLKDRADSIEGLKGADSETYKKIACETWIDVRTFGQVFSFKGDKNDSVSVGVRGPVAIQSAFSVHPIEITSTKITKSVNLVTSNKKTSDTMGEKHRVNYGLYVCYGSINSQLAQDTKFSDKDAALLKEILSSIFENDLSAARPSGSMEVHNVYWWEHNSPLGQYSSAKVHRSLEIKQKVESPTSYDDFEIKVNELDGLSVEVLPGY
ncbi:type I-C CRISPR-associated protein Cas7/Csd2 [Lysinibacillus fusiformis]|uniref:type I-C CRISPR-associated protein Cas7/Csd2 n=1 Tax=Lysinibacillus fusiformis TaxID=28031 RepID=UPI0021C1CE2F|nr:type I-C CRISPR-associated protein Cas7/Csd2 [Lysinibacillus fusiformis]UXJ71321.1 type I-C CRISPR-associated protein Cas7/Csd2 [Lysinibacillus fusiformis]